MISINIPIKMKLNLGNRQGLIPPALTQFEQNNIMSRILQHDHTVWNPAPQEITNRLGWLEIAEEFTDNKISELTALRDNMIESGFRDAVLLGMGGSSLAPELFSQIFSPKTKNNPALYLSILDSTCPLSVLDVLKRNDPAQTVFIVSTKSGATEETLSFFKYFYRLLVNHCVQNPGEHFIAITDPGTQLETLAKKLHFRQVLLNNPNLGGRYSALSYFGLAPATICGIDIPVLLERVHKMASVCRQTQELGNNPAVMLGLALGELAKSGCDKVTLIASPALQPFSDWVEQLIAESTGKEGKGILPVVGEPLGEMQNYAKDRVFVTLDLLGEEIDSEKIQEAGFPNINICLNDIYDLGGQFILWEMATAIAGYCLEINPFDQPNVEATKKNVRQLVDTFKATGEVPQEQPSFSENGISVFSDRTLSSIEDYLAEFVAQSTPGDYFAIQAFLYPQKNIKESLQDFRVILRDKNRLATSLGFGPRFLHSTGQLHKGDRGNGLFIQITSDFPQDLPIPDSTDTDSSSLSFGALIKAQAMGDLLALKQAGRRVLRFHIHDDPSTTIDYLLQILKSI